MKSIRKTTLVAPLLFLFAIAGAVKAETLSQQFLIFPPFWENTGSGHGGVHYDMAKVLFEEAGLDVEMREIPYARMVAQLEQGEATFINFGETEGIVTEDVVHICVPPTPITLMVYANGKDVSGFNSLESFKGQKVAIVEGLPLGPFEPMKEDADVNLSSPASVEAGLRMLNAGRTDYFVLFKNLVDYQASIDVSGLEAQELFSIKGYPIVTPKANAGGEAHCQTIRETYDRLVGSGVINGELGVLQSSIN